MNSITMSVLPAYVLELHFIKSCMICVTEFRRWQRFLFPLWIGKHGDPFDCTVLYGLFCHAVYISKHLFEIVINEYVINAICFWKRLDEYLTKIKGNVFSAVLSLNRMISFVSYKFYMWHWYRYFKRSSKYHYIEDI